MTRVMIVDDDKAILNTVSLILRRHGCEVVAAAGGRACLDEMRKGFHGVILMDIMMPDLNGWDTIRAILAANLLQGSLVCMLTARATPDPQAAGIEEAVFDYLPKPFDCEALLGLVDLAAACLEP
jgi:DNA-binding response OmpR family regulator